MTVETTPLRVRVNDDACCGYTTCANICPEVFKLDENGFAYVEDESVPAGLEERVRSAAAGCPEGAIVLE